MHRKVGIHRPDWSTDDCNFRISYGHVVGIRVTLIGSALISTSFSAFMAADLRQRVLSLMSRTGRPMMTLEIAKSVGLRTKKEANPTIYNMLREGLITRTQISPPMWQLTGASGSATMESAVPLRPPQAAPVGARNASIEGGGALSGRVIQLLQQRGTAMQTLHISKGVGLVTAKDINPTLYQLQREDVIVRTQISPPTWKLKAEGDESVSMTSEDQPQRKRARLSSDPVEPFSDPAAQSPFFQHHIVSPKRRLPGRIQQPSAQQVVQSINVLEKNPISAIHEYADKFRLKISLEFKDRGPDHYKTFDCVLHIGGQTFSGTARTKKDARLRASEQACQSLLHQPMPETVTSATGSSARADMSHGDRMAALSHNKLNTLLQSPECQVVQVGRKVMAAFIMTSPGSDPVVVSLGTGTRCVGGDALSLTGTTVNDCHAEIIARRGLRQFLFKEIDEYWRGQESDVFEQGRQFSLLNLKSGVEFHLYISTAPCGDGALFCHSDPTNAEDFLSDPTEHRPQFDNRSSGLLRTKVEGGEGTIPIPDDMPMTWDGIQRGERLRTMSCSDKIARWNFLGLQGALLSQFVETVYLSSITIGGLYKHGHLSRAVCCRIREVTGLPPLYRVNHPQLATVSEADKHNRSTQKTSSTSMNWFMGVSTVEILDGMKGKALNGSTSRLSKCAMFETYSRVCRNVIGMEVPATYRDAKLKADGYQAAKESLYEHLATKGYGQWMQKPEEQEQFS